MSSLFQGLAGANGKLAFTNDPTGTTAFRGLMVNPAGEILIAPDTGQVRTFHSGRAFDSVTGAMLVDPGVITPVLGMGGLTVDTEGGLILKDQDPDVIHQGVGLTDEGYITGSGGGVVPPAGAAFYAPLTTDLTEAVADYAGAVSRASDGWYLAGSTYQVAASNTPRFESEGLLIEPASTNLCTNFNANPDAALTNVIKGGDVATVVSRVSDSAALNSAGLGNICSSGFAIQVDNSGGLAPGSASIVGATAASTHTGSVFARRVSGSGSSSLGFTGGGFSTPITSSTYERVTATGVTALNEFLRVTAGAGDIVRFVVSQAEALPTSTSLIVTQGASSSRAGELLTYANGDSYLPSSGPKDNTVLWEMSTAWNFDDPNVAGGSLVHTGVLSRDTRANFHFGAYRISSATSDPHLQGWVSGGSYTTTRITHVDSLLRMSMRNGDGASDLRGDVYANSTNFGSVDRAPGNFYSNSPDFIIRPEALPFHIKNVIIYLVRQDDTWMNANWLCDGCFPL